MSRGFLPKAEEEVALNFIDLRLAPLGSVMD